LVEAVVIVEAAPDRHVVTVAPEVPLTHDRGAVALATQDLGERHLRRRQALLEDVLEARERDQVRHPEFAAGEEILEDVVLKAVPRIAVVWLELVAEALLVAARHQRRARRAADRRRDVAFRTRRALRPDRVDARRRHPAAVARDVGLPEVVGQDQDDVRRRRRVGPRGLGQVPVARAQLRLVDDDAEARARQRVQEPAEQRGDEDAEKKRALHRTRFRAWYRTAITTRSHAVRTIWSGPIFDPDTSVQRCKGISTK